MKLLIAIAFFASLLASPDQAMAGSDDETIERFRWTGSALMDAARAKGLTEVGGIPIDTVAQELHDIPVVVMPQNIRVTVEGRQTAMWSHLDRVVRLNPGIEKVDDETLGVLAIHETLGWYHKVDKFYDLSIGTVWRIANGFTGDISTAIFTKDIKNIRTKSLAGGSTVVGGGGDENDIHWRLSVYRLLYEVKDKNPAVLGGFSPELVSLTFGKMDFVQASDIQRIGEVWDIPDADPKVFVMPSGYQMALNPKTNLMALHLTEAYLSVAPKALGLVRIDDSHPSSTFGDWALVTEMTTELMSLSLDKTRHPFDVNSWRHALERFARSRLLFSSHLPSVYVVTPFQNSAVINIDQDKWDVLDAKSRRELLRKIAAETYFSAKSDWWQDFKLKNLWLGNPYTSDIIDRLSAIATSERFDQRSVRRVIWAIGQGLGKNWSFFASIQGPHQPLIALPSGDQKVWVDLSRWQSLTPEEKTSTLFSFLSK
jgi:hypothetical protein